MGITQAEEFVYQAVVSGDLEILSDGTIWRVRKRGWDRWKKEAVSRLCRRVRAEHDQGEYFQVRAMMNGKRGYALAHRMVYLHFQGPIPNGLTINHENLSDAEISAAIVARRLSRPTSGSSSSKMRFW